MKFYWLYYYCEKNNNSRITSYRSKYICGPKILNISLLYTWPNQIHNLKMFKYICIQCCDNIMRKITCVDLTFEGIQKGDSCHCSI